MRINCLPSRIFNKIAAGEVVERPASIVKELVENSIDAGATMVTVKIENGGISKINISDNGCGINFDDLKTAFLPHATSKIQKEEDLFGIKTLGFRGEALASIAAVSEVVLLSKEPAAENGGRIELSGGEIVAGPEVAGIPNGTDITIQNLFFNVPARAKFLKKPKTEEAEITSLMQKFILANPMVSIKYIVDNKIKYLSTGKGITDALFVVHGKEIVDNLVGIDKDYGYIKIYGYVGKPEVSKPNRTYQTIIINNRVVENATISGAVQNAYGEMLMKKQFPLFALYIDLDYEKIDVNVHPNKKEVRFENNSDIYFKVFETVNRGLANLDFTKTILTSENSEPVSIIKDFAYIPQPEVNVEAQNYTKPQSLEIANNRSTVSNAVSYSSGGSNRQASSKIEQLPERHTVLSAIKLLGDGEDELTSGAKVGSSLLEEISRKVEDSEQINIENIPTTTKIVGTLFNTYILIEDGDSVYFIDQHAGHERLLYDKFMKQLDSNSVEIQNMLVPYVFTVNAVEEQFLEDIMESVNKIGFDIQPFGGRTYRVTSVPYMLSQIDLKQFILELLSDIKNLKSITIKDLLNDEIASRACKSAVKGGDNLAEDEIKKLLHSFSSGNNKLLCPHGRPVVIKLPQKEIEKWFKRIV